MSSNGAFFPQGAGIGGYGFDDPAETDASFLLTVVPGDQMLALSWPAQQGALWYDVFCGANPENLVRVAKNIPATSFIIWNLVVGRPYYCQVIARYPDPRAGINTETVVGIPLPYVPQLAPVLSVTTDGTLMYLSWTAPPGTSYYSVNVSNKSGQEQTYLTGYRQTTLQVPNFNNGGGYFFNVTAYNISGAAATSNEVSMQSVANPVFKPPAGSYISPQNVVISSTPGAIIYYTTDGSVPTTNSQVYTGPVAVNQSGTLQAIAIMAGLLNSQPEAAKYSINLAGQMVGLSWKLPCLNGNRPYCGCALSVDNNTNLQAPAGTSYSATLRIRGVVETQTYSGGTQVGNWYVGGLPTDPTGNTYRLNISSPPQTYYINPTGGTPGILESIDFEETITINAGATVDLYANSGDSQEIPNTSHLTVANDNPAYPVVVVQPYDGQFAQLDAVALVPL